MAEQPEEQEPKLIIDEDWKTQVQREKEQAAAKADDGAEQEKEQAAAEPAEPSAANDEASEQALPPLPPASFEFLVSMLASQALDSMGQLPRPDGSTAKPQKNLAKHYIDLIGVLEEKTQGNLSDEEAKMVSQVLHQLRMAFLQVT
jgi:hypothetical protein